MNTDILIEAIFKAQLHKKAVVLHLNILPPSYYKPITIEPEDNVEQLDNILLINESVYISTEFIGMIEVINNKKDREKELTRFFNEMAEEK